MPIGCLVYGCAAFGCQTQTPETAILCKPLRFPGEESVCSCNLLLSARRPPLPGSNGLPVTGSRPRSGIVPDFLAAVRCTFCLYRLLYSVSCSLAAGTVFAARNIGSWCNGIDTIHLHTRCCVSSSGPFQISATTWLGFKPKRDSIYFKNGISVSVSVGLGNIPTTTMYSLSPASCTL